jgi:3-hydroxyacyl-[acyl-carrier-protein] dehydratase
MLLNNFFTINDLEAEGFDIKATLIIKADHKIFEGHFPGQPVVPGVCMMQMIKEVMEKVMGKKTALSKAYDMKFLSVIDPSRNNHIQSVFKYSIEPEGNMLVNATLFKDELVYFKFKGMFDFQP